MKKVDRLIHAISVVLLAVYFAWGWLVENVRRATAKEIEQKQGGAR